VRTAEADGEVEAMMRRGIRSAAGPIAMAVLAAGARRGMSTVRGRRPFGAPKEPPPPPRAGASATTTIAVFGAGYVLGAVIGERPVRFVRGATRFAGAGASRAARTARAGVSGVARTATRITPWTSSNGDRVIDIRGVTEVMSPTVEKIGPKATLADAAVAMRRAGVTETVVVKKQRARGIVSSRDIESAVRAGADPSSTRVGEVYRAGVATVAASSTVNDALDVMRRAGTRTIVVVDDAGAPTGIVHADRVSVGDRVRSIVARSGASA
jgi:CBS domain-containing protein